MLAQGFPNVPPMELRNELLLDRTWELHKRPLLQAGMEPLVAARPEPELRENLVEAQRDIARWIATGGPLLYPETETSDD
jgi:hypothetical protein